jgi:Tol biopolymer transport system component
MKHTMKHVAGLSLSVALLVANVGVNTTMAQEPVGSAHPYGAAWEARRQAPFAKDAKGVEARALPEGVAFGEAASDERMVFESYRDSNYEIYASNSDGAGAVRLTNNGDSDRFPRLRYGAISVAFTQGASGSRNLWSVRKDGSALTPLSSAQGFSDVAWSADGTKLVYARRGTTTDVYVANFDFAANAISDEVCLTCGSGRNNFEPAWSPDGKHIIFVKASATEPKGALWRMNADGTNQQQLTGEQWWIADVRWSPDGAQVAYDYASARDGWQKLGALTLATGKIREVYNPNQDRVDGELVAG